MQIELAPDPSLLAILAIFLVNYFVVRTFFLKPINEVLESREQETKSAEKLYEDALARFNDATAQMETQLHGAKREAAQVRDRFRGEAAAYRQEVVDRTGGEAKQIVAAADTSLQGDVKEAREKIARESDSLARLAAERILGRAVMTLFLVFAPAMLFAQHATDTTATHATTTHTTISDTTGATAAHGAETEAHKTAHPDEPPHSGAGGHVEKKYFGIPGWILKIANMLLFIGVLVYFVRGPVKKAFRDRNEQIRRAADEARERRTKADQMAGDIQARLTQIEADVRAIHERAQAEGERQKRELITAAEAEAQKILAAAKSEVDNRLKHARKELTEYAGQLATERAAAILKETITEDDQRKLFDESLSELSEVRS